MIFHDIDSIQVEEMVTNANEPSRSEFSHLPTAKPGVEKTPRDIDAMQRAEMDQHMHLQSGMTANQDPLVFNDAS